MNIDDIIKTINNGVTLFGDKTYFSECAGLSKNTLQNFKNNKDIKLSTLLKILETLKYKLKIEKE
jgi:hypothetical protein